jgi:hypothetical protein
MAFVVAGAACGGPTEPAAAFVRFTSDSPFCGGMPFTYKFVLDGRVLGTERLKHAQVSQAYETTPGTHIVTALFDGTINSVPDTTITLRAGETFTRVLSFYCS